MLTVEAYHEWYGGIQFVQPAMEGGSIYDEDLLKTGRIQDIIRNCTKTVFGVLSNKFRTEPGGDWLFRFNQRVKNVFADLRSKTLPAYWLNKSLTLQSGDFRGANLLLKPIQNALWGNGTPEEIQIAHFYAAMFGWENFVNSYACGINGLAFASNYLEFVYRGTAIDKGSDRGGPITRLVDPEKLYAKGEPYTPFLAGNGGGNKGPFFIITCDAQGRTNSRSWFGLADRINGKELALTRGSLQGGLRRETWLITPSPNNGTTWVMDNKATQTVERTHAKLAVF